MLLKFCEDNFVFYITHMKYFDILCYFIIFFLIVLYFLAQNNSFFCKFKNNFLSRFFLLVSSGLFVGFLIFLFILILSNDSFNGCMTKYNQNVYIKFKKNIQSFTEKINFNKIIVIGDSRMSLIDDDSELEKPNNMQFIAKSGMTIDWFKKDALDKLDNIIEDDDNGYHIIVNMGVNDLNYKQYKGDDIASDYFELYSDLASKYPKAKIYILSVNPIDEEVINNSLDNNRTTEEIELFNKTVQRKLGDDNKKNMYYCDSYNKLDFKTKDGLHYTQDTNREIIDYIVNKCVKF